MHFRKIIFGKSGEIGHTSKRLGAGGMARTFTESILETNGTDRGGIETAN